MVSWLWMVATPVVEEVPVDDAAVFALTVILVVVFVVLLAVLLLMMNGSRRRESEMEKEMDESMRRLREAFMGTSSYGSPPPRDPNDLVNDKEDDNGSYY